MKTCPRCGHENCDDSNFCSKCGYRFNPSEVSRWLLITSIFSYLTYVTFSFASLQDMGNIPNLMNPESVMIFLESNAFNNAFLFTLISLVAFLVAVASFRTAIRGVHERLGFLSSSFLYYGSRILVLTLVMGSVVLLTLDVDYPLFYPFLDLFLVLGVTGALLCMGGFLSGWISLARTSGKQRFFLIAILYLLPLIGLVIQ